MAILRRLKNDNFKESLKEVAILMSVKRGDCLRNDNGIRKVAILASLKKRHSLK